MATPEQRNLIDEFHETFPFLITVEDTMRFTLRMKAQLDRLEKFMYCGKCGCADCQNAEEAVRGE